MKEYGGYIELDEFRGDEYHTGGMSFNSGRSCLGYLIERRKIEKIYLPYFLCDTVKEACEKYGIQYEFYFIHKDFKINFSKKINENEYLYVVNYYGQLDVDYIKKLNERYSNVILDNAQDFFRKPISGMDTIYICRKFFGVADGAYLFSDINYEDEYQLDTTYERMRFLLGRYEADASTFYSEYIENNEYFANKPVMRTSKLTRNILRGIDYQYCKERRTENYKYLHNQLKEINELKLCEVEGAFAYPLLLKNGYAVRKKLIEKKIYIPTLWPDVFNKCSEDSLEYRYANNILPIPVDQRYDVKDMENIYKILKEIAF